MSSSWRAMSVLALLLAGASILLTAFLFTKLTTEGEERRDQSCRMFEGDHLDEVNQLKRTYSYLERQKHSNDLTREIVRGLPDLERRAREDRAPEYCDEPGAKAEAEGAKPVGLPEPDPALPAGRNFDYLLK